MWHSQGVKLRLVFAVVALPRIKLICPTVCLVPTLHLKIK